MSATREAFFQWLQGQAHPVTLDGAMGTMLHMRGISFDQCFDALNLERPALVADIHRQYLEAGAQILLTNTFGANRFRLAEHGLEDRVAEINRAGVELARRAILAAFKENQVLVAGDIGPLGVRLAPFGRVSPEEARAAFREQIQALVDAGVDLLVIETMVSLDEAHQAFLAAREVAPHLPVVVSMTYTRDDRTLLGETPAQVARQLRDWGVDVVGANCSGGPAQLLRVLKAMRKAVPEALYWVKPNAGWPERLPGGRILYPATPDYFGDYARQFAHWGARFIGGCCGTTPQHIRVIAETLAQIPLARETETDAERPSPSVLHLSPAEDEEPESEDTWPSQLARKLAQGRFVFTVEMSPPRGVSLHKTLAHAALLKEAGADVINVADSPMARMRMSPWAVCHLIQEEVGIETTLHFPTRGRNLLRVQGDLLAAHALGIRNIFVVMGDPTAIGDYPDAMDAYDLVPSGLIKLIKQSFNQGRDYAGNALDEPTRFFIGCALNLMASDPDREIKVLRRKIRAGADFALTQPVYEPEKARRLLERYEERYGPLPIPVLVGVLPLYSARHARFLHNEVPGIVVPETVIERLERAGDRAWREGLALAVDLVHRLREWAQGVYLMPPFRKYWLAAEILERAAAVSEAPVRTAAETGA